MLHDTLRENMQKAMKAREVVRLGTLRMALAACTNTLIEQGKKPDEKLKDDGTISVIKRLVKQRKESAEHYRAANQEDRAKAEDEERTILEEYLPPEMSEDEIKAIVAKKQQELEMFEKKDTGTLMKAVMQELKGQADGATVSKIVAETLT